MSDKSEVRGVPEIMGLVADLARALGVKAINTLEGPWVHKIDERWTVAVNGKRETVQCAPDGTMGAEIGPFEMVFWWNGWWSGAVNANTEGGWFAAHPDGASEERVIADLRSAIEKAKVKR